jgi:hypothetical protein
MQLGCICQQVVYHTHRHTTTCIQLHLLGTLQMGFTWTTPTSWCLSFEVLVSCILQYSGVTFDLRNGKVCWNFYAPWRHVYIPEILTQSFLRNSSACGWSCSTDCATSITNSCPLWYLQHQETLRIGMRVISNSFAAHKPQFLALFFVCVDVNWKPLVLTSI